MQGSNPKKLKPIYYGSRKTNDVEAKLYLNKLELMAIVWSIDRLNLKFSDQELLIYLNAKKILNAQVATWAILLE